MPEYSLLLNFFIDPHHKSAETPANRSSDPKPRDEFLILLNQ
jgi:hypothetical protein